MATTPRTAPVAPVLARRDRVVIVGSGAAGLALALDLAPMPVTLVTRGRLRDPGSTVWAQGGIAAALDAADAPWRHARDTIAVGSGLTDAAMAAWTAEAAPTRIASLEALGLRFDRDGEGRYMLAREGGHSCARVAHAGGDGSGAALIGTLATAVEAAPHVEVVEHMAVDSLLLAEGRVVGVRGRSGATVSDIPGRAVALATGGAGALYAATTNPLSSWGSGLALGARAGAVLRDMEFVQFHPTAIDVDADPLPLASEALRGAGARLVDGDGEPIAIPDARADLAPRDVIARAIWRHRRSRGPVYLDTQRAFGAAMADLFPTVTARCRDAGLDPSLRPIPVCPAAHYHMGGLKVDTRGRTSVDGLWAVGEVACTGLHGGNRLASNSLLEALVVAGWSAADIKAAAVPTAVPTAGATPVVAASACTTLDTPSVQVRRVMTAAGGVLRDGAGLAAGLVALDEGLAADRRAGRPVPAAAEVGLTILVAALRRQESRGAHQREDAPAQEAALPPSRDITLAEAHGRAAELNREGLSCAVS